MWLLVYNCQKNHSKHRSLNNSETLSIHITIYRRNQFVEEVAYQLMAQILVHKMNQLQTTAIYLEAITITLQQQVVIVQIEVSMKR